MKEMRNESKRKEKFVQICQIQGYENIKDYYYLSNSDEDKVINENTGKQLKIRLNDRGYKRINLQTKDGKVRNCKIHIMKAKAFIYSPNPLSYNVVRHLNDVKIDNRLENLVWGTQSDNNLDCIRNGNYNYEAAAKASAKGAKVSGKINGAKNGKRSSKAVKCLETGVIYPSTREAGRRLGILNAGISLCCRGKRHMAGGLHWTYVDKEVNSNDMECK